ncbi:MAG: RsmE family RNA methyltransferase [Microthrixaceae bacterium]
MTPERSASPTPWRSAAAQVLVTDLAAPELEPADLHHLQRVLRLRVGDQLCATNGHGGWRTCAFLGTEQLESLSELHQEPPPEYTVTVGFALVKGDRPELVVQKLTELGVDQIWPFMSHRSVVRWDEQRAEKQLTRLRRVAQESCAQSRRLWLPQVGYPSNPDQPLPAAGLAGFREVCTQGAVLAQMGSRDLHPTDRTVLIGPEGGWEKTECEGADCVGLGEHVLRAETAAITAGVLLTAQRAGFYTQSLR